MAKERAGWRCERCNLRPRDRDFLNAHHVRSYGLGGPTRADNLRCLCRRCHMEVEGRTPSPVTEWQYAQGGVVTRPEDSVKPPQDWEGQSLGEQAERIREHARRARRRWPQGVGPIITPVPKRRRKRRQPSIQRRSRRPNPGNGEQLLSPDEKAKIAAREARRQSEQPLGSSRVYVPAPPPPTDADHLWRGLTIGLHGVIWAYLLGLLLFAVGGSAWLIVGLALANR